MCSLAKKAGPDNKGGVKGRREFFPFHYIYYNRWVDDDLFFVNGLGLDLLILNQASGSAHVGLTKPIYHFP